MAERDDNGRHETDLLPDYVGGELPEGERAALEAHLATCPTCRAELELLEALRSAPEPHLGREETERLYVPLPERPGGAWRVGAWRAAAGVAVVLISYAIWQTTQAGRDGRPAWSAEDAVAGWDADLTELQPGVTDLRVALGSSDDLVWPELEPADLTDLVPLGDTLEEPER